MCCRNNIGLFGTKRVIKGAILEASHFAWSWSTKQCNFVFDGRRDRCPKKMLEVAEGSQDSLTQEVLSSRIPAKRVRAVHRFQA